MTKSLFKPQYEVQSNNTTIIMTKSMREVNDAWAKSANCELYEFEKDGSKHLVNTKRTPRQKTTQFQLHFGRKVVKEGKQGKVKLDKLSKPVERQIKRKRDRVKSRKNGNLTAY